MVDPDYLGTGVGTFLVQTLFFGLRIVSRCMGVGKWGWDDHVCILAYVSPFPPPFLFPPSLSLALPSSLDKFSFKCMYVDWRTPPPAMVFTFADGR